MVRCIQSNIQISPLSVESEVISLLYRHRYKLCSWQPSMRRKIHANKKRTVARLIECFCSFKFGRIKNTPECNGNQRYCLKSTVFPKILFFKSVHVEWYTRALKRADFSAYSVSRRSVKTQHCATKFNLRLVAQQTSSVTEYQKNCIYQQFQAISIVHSPQSI